MEARLLLKVLVLISVLLSTSGFCMYSVRNRCLSERTVTAIRQTNDAVTTTKKIFDDKLPNLVVEPDPDGLWKARLSLVIIAALYGTDFAVLKVLEHSLHPGVASTYRFLIATLMFLPQLLKACKENRSLVYGGLEVGVYAAIGYIAQAKALLTSHAANVAFITSLSVVTVPLLESIFDQTKDGVQFFKKSITPAVIAAVGVAILELGGGKHSDTSDSIAYLQPIFFGLAYWRIEQNMSNVTQPYEAQAFASAIMLVSALGSALYTLFTFVLPISQYGQDLLLTSLWSQVTALQDWHISAALLWTGVVTTALTSYGENLALRKLNAAESTVIYSTEPLWGTAFAAVTLHEEIGWNTGIGAVFVLAACLWNFPVASFFARQTSTSNKQ